MQVYTDGSHSIKPRLSGYGAVIISEGKEYQIGGYNQKCLDNNVAEIMAIAFALKFIKDNLLNKSFEKSITIFSDSAYALRKIKQQSMGRNKEEQAMLDYIQRFISNTKKKVHFFQIKGHTHDGTKISHYNHCADRLANQFRQYGLESLNKPFNRYI